MISTSEKANFLRKVFGPLELSRDKINVAVKCPACSKTSGKKKLVIRLDDDRYHCWVCGIKGRNLLPLVKKYAPNHAEECKRYFYKKASTSLLEEETPESAKIPAGFTLLALSLQRKDPDIRETLKYVKSRGLSVKDMWYFRMGTCLTGNFRRRVIIPSFDNEGKLSMGVNFEGISEQDLKLLNDLNNFILKIINIFFR